MDPADELTRTLLLVVPQFNLLSLHATVEPMRAANKFMRRKIYEWNVVAKHLGPVIGSNGLSIMPEMTLDQAPEADLVVVCASLEVPDCKDAKILNFLRSRAKAGAVICGIGAGSGILARAGLLNGYRCSVHWEIRSVFIEEFPKVLVSSKIFEIDRDRITCGGGVAALDMMMHVITEKHGPAVGLGISNALLHARLRSPDDHQRTAVTLRLEQMSPKLADAIHLMEKYFETPLRIPQISRRVGLPQRRMERLFHKHFGVTPRQYYLDLRLDFARQLVLNTGMSILDVAVASGFSSAAHFSSRYFKKFGITPNKQRGVMAGANLRSA